MQLKIKTLNFLQKTNFILLLLLVVLNPILAQEVVTVDSTGVAKNSEIEIQQTKKDSVKNFNNVCPTVSVNRIKNANKYDIIPNPIKDIS